MVVNREPNNRPPAGANTQGGSKILTALLLLLGAGVVCAVVALAAVLIYGFVNRGDGDVTPVAVATEFSPIVDIPTLTPAAATEPPSASPSPVVEPPTAVPTAGQPITATPAITNPTAVPATAAPTAAAPPTAAPTDKPRIVKMRSPDYGMQVFTWWRAEVAQRDVEMVRDAGFRWVKQDFAWREIEGRGKGQFDWSIADRVVAQVESMDLRLMVRLDSDPSWASGVTYPNDAKVIMSPPRNYQDFADYAYAVASRFKGRVAAYQIWNEPNLAREWGGQPPSPADYTRLLKAGYEAIKRADPSALVITAGMAPTTRNDHVAKPDTEFLKEMYRAGAAAYFGALGAHGAGYKAPPEMDPAEVSTNPAYYNKGDVNCPGPACRIYCFRHVEDLRQIMVDNGDKAKRVVVLEFGWTIDSRPNSPYGWHAVTEEQQADYFVRAYEYAHKNWQPWIGVMSLIYMPDIEWTEEDEQYWWSIAIPNYPQFLPRKAYRDLAVMPKYKD